MPEELATFGSFAKKKFKSAKLRIYVLRNLLADLPPLQERDARKQAEKARKQAEKARKQAVEAAQQVEEVGKWAGEAR
jgi:hypothetical protein